MLRLLSSVSRRLRRSRASVALVASQVVALAVPVVLVLLVLARPEDKLSHIGIIPNFVGHGCFRTMAGVYFCISR